MNTARFRALIFDLDGTLTLPSLDFRLIRQEIGISRGDLVTEIGKLPPAEREQAWAVVRRHEEEAMRNQTLQDGTSALLERCRRERIRVGVVTRNERQSIDHLCLKYGLTFDAAVSREFPHVKPHPGPVLHMLELWQIAPGEALVIGDYLYDIDCGRAAGTKTCFFQNQGSPFYGQNADYVVGSMKELAEVVWPSP